LALYCPELKFRDNITTVLVRAWQETDGALKLSPIETSLMKGLSPRMWTKLREPQEMMKHP
jgi:hypothetical protein